MVYKRVCRNCPISSFGAKYLVRLANHLADVHQLDHIQRRQYLQEAKLQPKVKVVVYESEADNSGKKSLNWYWQSSTDTRNGARTVKITRNEASFKVKAKRTTKENRRQTERDKESRTLGLEAMGKLYRHGMIIYYSSKYNRTEKRICNSQSKD